MRVVPILLLALEGDADGYARVVGIAGVVEVISAVVVVDVAIVGLIPVGSPELRVRIEEDEPVSGVLEARVSADVHERQTIDAEEVARAVVEAEVVGGYAVAVVSAALTPGAVLGVPIGSATLTPDVALLGLLALPLLDGAALLHAWLALALILRLSALVLRAALVLVLRAGLLALLCVLALLRLDLLAHLRLYVFALLGLDFLALLGLYLLLLAVVLSLLCLDLLLGMGAVLILLPRAILLLLAVLLLVLRLHGAGVGKAGGSEE